MPGRLSAEEEAKRLQALEHYRVLDSSPEQGYEDVTELAAFICGTPISLITFIDKERQWFKSARGTEMRETPLSQSFCINTLEDGRTLVVEDARLDPRFQSNPLVAGDPNVRFYAGAPIVEKDGHVLGTVCVVDVEPRKLSPKQISALEALARQVMTLLEQRRTISRLEQATTQSQTAGRLLHDSERRFESFADSFPTLAWVANPDGWITWYNRRWYEYTGTTPQQMAGWGWQTVHDANVLPTVMEKWTASIRTGAPFEMVFPLRGADGLLRTFLTRGVPLRDESGTVIQWFGTNTEIDELQRTRMELEASEAGLNQVMHATSDAVTSINRDWVLTYMNPVAERMYGSAKEVVGRNIWEKFPDMLFDGSPFIEHYHGAMHDRVAGRFEAHYTEPAPLTIAVEVYPSREGVVIFSRDITKLKVATAAALQNEKLAAVGRLASSIAHEINNPLESVTNLLYLARHSSDGVRDEYLDGAERELRRVSTITNQTLRFYKQTTRASAVTGEQLFKETLSLYQGRLLNSKIQVEKRDRATRPAVCFEGEIRQVLSNIMGNAIDAMHPRGGWLMLRSRDTTHWKTGRKGLALTIADTGTGMAETVRKRIFEAFFSTKGIGGTGLGLWISNEIVERHKGSISVRSSTAPAAHGTVFVMFLPYEMSQ